MCADLILESQTILRAFLFFLAPLKKIELIVCPNPHSFRDESSAGAASPEAAWAVGHRAGVGSADRHRAPAPGSHAAPPAARLCRTLRGLRATSCAALYYGALKP